MKRISLSTMVLALAATLVAGCSGGAGHFAPAVPDQPASGAMAEAPEALAAPFGEGVLDPNASKIVLKPAAAALLSTGTISKLAVKVSEKGYTGGFKQTNTCKKFASIAPASLTKAGSFTLQGKAAGSCAVTIKDTLGNKTVLKVTDTVAKIALSASSISPGSKSVTIVLKTVNGKPPKKGLVTTVKTNLPSCAGGCSIPGPQAPAGKDTFNVTVFDGSTGAGNALAGGTVNGTVTAGKVASIGASLSKNVKTVSITSVPSAAAGTAIAGAAIALSVQDADGNPVTGTYANAVTISSNDTSGATTLGGGTGSATQQSFTGSSQQPTLAYSGLAISAVTLTPASTGATTGTSGNFSPTILPVQYTGPTVSANPEIDLYATSGTGSTANFTVSQSGWTNSPFGKNTTYAACNGNAGSYTISPATGTGNAYTVTATNAAVAGSCNLTINGGGGGSVVVKLTYTTSSVGINEKTKKHKP